MPVKRAQRFICGRRTLVPAALGHTVLELANAGNGYVYTRDDVSISLVCTIEAHPASRIHHGAVLNLRGREAGTLWAQWRDRSDPTTVVEKADCSAGREADNSCSEFKGHPGGHSWELDDPPRIAAEFPLPRRPAP